MKKYELMIIVKASLSEQDVKDVVSQDQELVKSFGGTVEKQDLWGKRKFAYEINRNTEGYYAVFNIALESEGLAKFKQKMNLLPDLIRYLVTATK